MGRLARIDTRPSRFWAKVDKAEGCWLWTGKCNRDGYGYIDDRGAHRVAYELSKGPIPTGLFVCHSCDNKRCVNPSHLWAGGAAANTQDMIAKGRGNHQRKTHCAHGHEFTPENTRLWRGARHCRACKRARDRARRAA